jgi:UDP-2,3-diacylglucosamine pyrophosphatase LpxH
VRLRTKEIIYPTSAITIRFWGGPTRVIATSDHHLGYVNTDKAAFNAFLDELAQEDDLTHLVLLGDFVDMWRTDASGVFLEGHDTIRKLLALKSKGVQVFYVAGNHDYHVVDLEYAQCQTCGVEEDHKQD